MKVGIKLGLLIAILALTVGLSAATTATQPTARVYRMAMHEDMTTTSFIQYMSIGNV